MSSITTFIAAMLAMFLSMRLGLLRPWWVLMAVYVTTQPLAGTLRPKMTYRLMGVGLGALVAVLIVPHFINAPFSMVLALGGWVGVCIYFAVLDRTPRAYIFMLAAYTAAIVGFPYVDQPGDIFEIALVRVEEMSLGIVCATVVHAIVLPWNPASVLDARLNAFLADARLWFADAFRGLHGFREDQERRRFAGDIAELSIISVHLPPDAFGVGANRRHVTAMQERMSVLLPLASAAEDRLDALRRRNAVTPSIVALIEDLIAWMADTRHPSLSSVRDLQARCRAIAPPLGLGASWDDLLTASLCQRLSEFVEAYADSRELARHIATDSHGENRRVDKLLRRRRPARLPPDHALAALSGAAAAAAVLAYCSLWIVISWPEGAATAAFAAIVSCSFSSQDDPAPAILKYLGFTLTALPVSAIYLFAILPVTTGFTTLALALAPVLIVMGYIQADPARAPYALPMLACFIVAMGFLDRYTGDFARFFNVALAQIGGIIVTIGAAGLFRSVGADWSAKRMLRGAWQEVAKLAADSRASDEITWSHHMLDRLGLIAARMALIRARDGSEAADALRDLRIGRNVIHLRRTQVAASEPALAARLQDVLDRLSTFYGERVRRRSAIDPPAALLHTIDGALSHLHEAAAGETRRHGFLALAGLRRNLFPQAEAYQAAVAA